MKTVNLIIYFCCIFSTLFSVIDRTITIDTQLMQSLRDNLSSSTSTDPLIRDYLSTSRNDDEDLVTPSDTRIVNFNREISDYARVALYQSIKYGTPDYNAAVVDVMIRGICNDPTSNHYIYIKPPGMTSPNQSVSGANPGSIVQLLYNTDNNYSFYNTLPFDATQIPSGGNTLDSYNRGYYVSNGLAFVSFIYDMLYYEMTPTQKDLASENIEILSGYIYNYLQNPTAIGMTPWNNHYAPLWGNTRADGSLSWEDGMDKINLLGTRPLELLCSLGYSRLVLGYLPGNDQILDWVLYMLESVPIQGDFYGLMSYVVKKSGAFVSGFDYASQDLEGPPQIFFTALKRLANINLWNNPYLVKWMNSIVDNLRPSYGVVPLEDCWWSFNGHESGFFDRGLVEYYYQNTNDIIGKNKIKWYLYRQKAIAGRWPNTKVTHYLINFTIPYSFNPVGTVSNDDYQPLSSLSGIFSNQEFTHLSPPLAAGQNFETPEYHNRLWLHVNHENSYEEENFHTDQEKGHYRLYYDSKQFIIDTGYRAEYADWWRTLRWFRSIYSKNMVIVNPDSDNEQSYIGQQYTTSDLPSSLTVLLLKRPLSGSQWNQYTGIDNLVDDCRREFLVTNKDIHHLKIRINYNDLTPGADGHVSYSPLDNTINARLERNFYTFGNQGLVVYDKVTSLNEQSNTYRDQLHFHPDANMDFDPVTGIFTASIAPSHMHGVMGALANRSSKRIDGKKVAGVVNDLLYPNGLPTGSESIPINTSNIIARAHSRIRVDTGSSTEAKFFTYLIPSSSVTNPITLINESENAYIAYANIDSNNQVYSGVSKQSQSMINGLRFTTNAEFFYINANTDFSNLKSMIINNGNGLAVRDFSIAGFGDVEVFKGYNDNVEEYIAEWDSNALTVTINSEHPQYPRFKLIRSGVSPSDISVKTMYQIDWNDSTIIETDEPVSRGCISDAIRSLAYDADYFYVNYSWEELENEGLITDSLVIAKGDIPETMINASISFKGSITISGDLTIPLSKSLSILPDTHVVFTGDYGIFNHGFLTIDGGDTTSVSIGNGNQTWMGITTYRDGELNCSNAIINNAMVGVYIRGTATLHENEIRNCAQGVSIETGTPFHLIGNLIKQNTYGILISNNFSTSNSGGIEGNEVTENGYGIVMYNSNTMLTQNDIYANTRGGVYLIRDSEPIIVDNNISHSENESSTRPEITLDSESYPVIDDAWNDINSDGLGYSLYNMSTNSLKQLSARNNYWGSSDGHQILGSIYPAQWDVVFDPFSTTPNTFFLHLGDNLFKQALAAEMNGDFEQAKQLYTAVVTTQPDSLFALQSLGRLTSIYAASPSQFSVLRSIYDSYIDSCSDSVLVRCAEIKQVMLDRYDSLYLDALQNYEDLMQRTTSAIDSMLCLLDIAFTLQDIYYDSLSKGSYTGLSYYANGVRISSLKEAKQAIDLLLNGILTKPEMTADNNSPVPSRLSLMNYPNPFNPSTTIAFELPVEGKVNVSIYNIRGQKVRDLVNGDFRQGFHKVIWDGIDKDNHPVSSGVYLLKLDTNNQSVIKRMIMLK